MTQTEEKKRMANEFRSQYEKLYEGKEGEENHNYHKVMHCEKGHLIQFNNERGLWRCACCSPEQWHTINDFVELIKKSRSSAVTTCDVEEERETSPLPISNKRK